MEISFHYPQIFNKLCHIDPWSQEKLSAPTPTWKEQAGSVVMTFEPSQFFEKQEPFFKFSEEPGQVAGHVTGQDEILVYCQQLRTAKELMDFFKSQTPRNLLQKPLKAASEAEKA